MLLPNSMLLSAAVAFLFSTAAQADHLRVDLCWCQSDDMVGFVKHVNYRNRRSRTTVDWATVCADKPTTAPDSRLSEGRVLDWDCDDVRNMTSCTPLPDVRRYNCYERMHQVTCNNESMENSQVCLDSEYVWFNGVRRRVPVYPSAPYVVGFETEHSPPDCAQICNAGFANDTGLSHNIRPLCDKTYLKESSKHYGSQVGITGKPGRHDSVKPEVSDDRGCHFWDTKVKDV